MHSFERNHDFDHIPLDEREVVRIDTYSGIGKSLYQRIDIDRGPSPKPFYHSGELWKLTDREHNWMVRNGIEYELMWRQPHWYVRVLDQSNRIAASKVTLRYSG